MLLVLYVECNMGVIYTNIWGVIFLNMDPQSKANYLNWLTWLKSLIAVYNWAVTSVLYAGDKISHHWSLLRIYTHEWEEANSFMSQISVRVGSMCPISLLCHIHYTIKITLVQCVAPAVWFARAYAEPSEEKKKKTSAGHHFHWQLLNKLKQRDAGTIFLPPLFFSLFTLFLFSSSVADNCSFPLKIFLEVMGFSGAGMVEGIYHSWVVHSKDFLLRFTPSIHFSSYSPLQHFFSIVRGSIMID